MGPGDPAAVLPGLGGGPVAQLADTAPDRDGVRWMALDWLTAPVQHTGQVDVSAHPGAPVAPPPAPPSPFPALQDDDADDRSGPAWPWGP